MPLFFYGTIKVPTRHSQLCVTTGSRTSADAEFMTLVFHERESARCPREEPTQRLSIKLTSFRKRSHPRQSHFER